MTLTTDREQSMATVHAWFSAEQALLHGSAVYRKPGGNTVNVTRTSPEKEGKGSYRADEKYLGQVVPGDEGGCVRPIERVRGITG
jgi:hypothetical protein